MALKSGGLSIEVWDSWSSRSAKYSSGICEERWESFKGNEIGIGTLFHYAKQNGYNLPHSQNDAPAPVMPLQTFTAKELLETELPPQHWAVEPILPEGLTVLAGPSKIGKSWLAYSLACAVAQGTRVLGQYMSNQGKVLYLALEDNKRRLQRRLRKLAGDFNYAASPNLELCTAAHRLDEGGFEELKLWLEGRPDCKLVVIDTLGRISSDPKRYRNAYDNDYRALAPLQQMAIEKQIVLLLVTHTPSGPADMHFRHGHRQPPDPLKPVRLNLQGILLLGLYISE